jgi:5-oxoprolinase (ATP-hydrolysing)
MRRFLHSLGTVSVSILRDATNLTCLTRDTAFWTFIAPCRGRRLRTPAILVQDTATVVVEPDCTASITEYGDIEILVGQQHRQQVGTEVDPVQLSIFSNLFMSIAEQMGRMLQKTAVSTNIKERMDFSCALFNPDGHLVANAPHVPVHLGAMSEAVREQIRRCPDLNPGDVLLTNHPAAGGSHLPDITVITPVFKEQEIIFWVASRGHHADIGGISPGSMPPTSRQLIDEGVAIVSFKLVQDGVFQEEGIRQLLLHPSPGQQLGQPVRGSRRLADNLSDLKAQVSANQKGIDLILEMVDYYGLAVVQAYMDHVQHTAEEAVRASLCALSRGKGLAPHDTVRAVDYLDDGSPIALQLTIDRNDGSAVFDFTGTGPELWGNLNAPRAVTQSAILYSLRCLVEKDIPLNHGCLLPITLIIPKGSLLAPSPNAAVVGGNVLTSQRVVDVVLKAFGVAAASQGCMNNLTFGNDQFGYYETIAGGAGAGPDWHGQSGVHTHMTNTRITDPEILERRYPVLVREFSIRRNSGGKGIFHGGDGLVRDLEFEQPLNVAILSERRVFAPYGLDGGQPGKPGKNLFIRRDGRIINLGGKNEIRAEAGDRIKILTPGGGGYGPPAE